MARWALVDFDAPANRSPESALFLARPELKRKYNFRFPTFDLAYAAYWEQSHPQTSLARSSIPWLDEGDVLTEIISVASNIPIVSLIAKPFQLADRLGWRAREWWIERGNEALQMLPQTNECGHNESCQSFRSVFFFARFKYVNYLRVVDRIRERI